MGSVLCPVRSSFQLLRPLSFLTIHFFQSLSPAADCPTMFAYTRDKMEMETLSFFIQIRTERRLLKPITIRHLQFEFFISQTFVFHLSTLPPRHLLVNIYTKTTNGNQMALGAQSFWEKKLHSFSDLPQPLVSALNRQPVDCDCSVFPKNHLSLPIK